jgi:trk system potassium uptake protein
MVDALNRTITTYVHGQFVKVEENATVTDAVSLLHSKKAETAIVVTKEGKPIGIVTDTVMRINKIKRLPVTDKITNKIGNDNNNSKIIGIVTQESLAYAVRGSVIEKTFRPYRTYRIMVVQGYKPIIGNLGFLLQFAGIFMIVPALSKYCLHLD